MSARGEHGWPDAGMAQTRIVAPASGMPRVLKTMSSLREPCACAGATMPGHTCSASVSNAHRNVIVLARLKRDAIFDRIIYVPFSLVCAGERRNEKSRLIRDLLCKRTAKLSWMYFSSQTTSILHFTGTAAIWLDGLAQGFYV